LAYRGRERVVPLLGGRVVLGRLEFELDGADVGRVRVLEV
jgi:hypothetical protein